MSVELDELDRLAASVFDGYLVRKDLVRRVRAAISRADLRGRVPAGALLRQRRTSTKSPKGCKSSRSSSRTARCARARKNSSRPAPRRTGSVKPDRHREGAAGREERLLRGRTAEPAARRRADRRRAGARERADADRRLLRRGRRSPTTASSPRRTDGRPFGIESLRPIQMSKSDVLDSTAARPAGSSPRGNGSTSLIRSIGLEPAALR